jgi:hypothetical protein
MWQEDACKMLSKAEGNMARPHLKAFYSWLLSRLLSGRLLHIRYTLSPISDVPIQIPLPEHFIGIRCSLRGTFIHNA